ncbi:MAG: valine--tRNA ligase [Patescibacteria group bacterium]
MNADFSKPYDPKITEEKIYQLWLDSGYFNPDNLPAQAGLPVAKIKNSKIKNYVVYMPLPNVTGTLHMGHALNNTIQDILIRYHRMKGYKTLWLPGTDHAGIATQYVVEKDLRKQNISRFELGREKFVEKVWEWKQKYGDAILNQLKKIGISADWSRTRFTMDEAYSQDVLKVFVHYYEKGWLYRGLRTVNWCPKDGTSLSELELEYEDTETKLWYIKYSPEITVATTRPETMLGDTAIAVNPADKRYKHLIGKTVVLPIQNREIPIVGDIAIDPKFGTGAVKVTPAHDILDFEIGQRHKLETIQVIDERAKMTVIAGKYAGLKAVEAREKIVNDLKEMGLLVKEEKYQTRVAKCYRCGTIIEPIPSNQWFLKMDKLGAMAKQAVKSKKVRIQPKNFDKTYLNWLENVRDWSVSRQIWWGHRLPVWFHEPKCVPKKGREKDSAKCEEMVVSLTEPECKYCEGKYIQSEDVLDTWFSSALWPFAGLSKEDAEKYYPGNVLVTARDIINLWVARMIFSGLELKKKVPFTDVFINGTILAKDGRRMSKSLGTGIDPLNYIGLHGADATRFAIIWQASGQDIRWDEAAVMAGRKFCNKIWNASRFVIEQSGNPKSEILNPKPRTAADKKILKKLAAVKKQTGKNIEKFEFSKALHDIYDFFWHEFCDIYIEEAKKIHPVRNSPPQGPEGARRAGEISNGAGGNSAEILMYVLKESLKMLHPFMPFITEAIYKNMAEKNGLLMIEKW